MFRPQLLGIVRNAGFRLEVPARLGTEITTLRVLGSSVGLYLYLHGRDIRTSLIQRGAAKGMVTFSRRVEKRQDGIWIIDVNGQTVYANQRMAEILRTTPAEMVGHPSFDYVFPEDVEAAQRLFDAKKRGDTNPFHFRLRCKDGTSVAVDVQGTPLYNAAGRFNGIVGTFSVSS